MGFLTWGFFCTQLLKLDIFSYDFGWRNWARLEERELASKRNCSWLSLLFFSGRQEMSYWYYWFLQRQAPFISCSHHWIFWSLPDLRRCEEFRSRVLAFVINPASFMSSHTKITRHLTENDSINSKYHCSDRPTPNIVKQKTKRGRKSIFFHLKNWNLNLNICCSNWKPLHFPWPLLDCCIIRSI